MQTSRATQWLVNQTEPRLHRLLFRHFLSATFVLGDLFRRDTTTVGVRKYDDGDAGVAKNLNWDHHPTRAPTGEPQLPSRPARKHIGPSARSSSSAGVTSQFEEIHPHVLV